ncbi:MAG: Asp-tRNA(Asn)/Glu-tRNA(Gln) amidotransferase GatCAB subunit B [Thermoprotei archaeon]|nr:MAG: Asp-tRNA(Asn)/Glu-tRNA(Gln) amidotransferase GatCAB subunit B [Thermoprotei archaeon]
MSEVRIGLEIHCQLTNLKTKLFCRCPADYRGKPPNTHVCPTCLGLPGSLPVVNRKAIEDAVKVALALNCQISRKVLFYRKNYFYPDLPKNFQISQYDYPIGVNGKVLLNLGGVKKEVRIRRVHLEEDPGKLVYKGSILESPYTLVDYNRAGVALVEIVTEPDLESPREARLFLQQLRSILEHLGVFDGSLEGAMRCDANISVAGGARIEVKNISSFKEVEKALQFELLRQRNFMRMGLKIERETRHWDEARGVTVTLRVKEEEMDYRYFPEPDLVPIELTPEFIDAVKRTLPELPDARRERFIRQYGLPEAEAAVLVSSKALADFFEETAAACKDPVKASKFIVHALLGVLNYHGIDLTEAKVTPKHIAELVNMVEEGVITEKTAKYMLRDIVLTGRSPEQMVAEEGLQRIADRAVLEEAVEKVLEEEKEDVEAALKEEKVIHHLVGHVLKLTRMKADPKLLYEMIKERIDKLRAAREEGR